MPPSLVANRRHDLSVRCFHSVEDVGQYELPQILDCLIQAENSCFAAAELLGTRTEKPLFANNAHMNKVDNSTAGNTEQKASTKVQSMAPVTGTTLYFVEESS